MSRIRIGAAGLVVAALAAGSGVGSTLGAQASGTLQASVTVLDDRVNRLVRAAVTDFAADPEQERLEEELRVTYGPEGVSTTVRVLPDAGAIRRIRIDVVPLD